MDFLSSSTFLFHKTCIPSVFKLDAWKACSTHSVFLSVVSFRYSSKCTIEDHELVDSKQARSNQRTGLS